MNPDKKCYVVFFGSHSTGKTTLARELLKQLTRLRGGCFHLEKSGSRLVKSIDPEAEINTAVNDLTQLRITFLNFSMLLAATERFVVAERFVFDNLVYARLGRCDQATTAIHESICTYLVSPGFLDSCLFIPFYLPIEFGLEVDEVRSDDLVFQRTVDNRLRELLVSYGVEVTEVCGTVEQRMAIVAERLRSDFILLPDYQSKPE